METKALGRSEKTCLHWTTFIDDVRIFNSWARGAKSDHLLLNEVVFKKCTVFSLLQTKIDELKGTCSNKLLGSDEPIKPMLSPPLTYNSQPKIYNLVNRKDNLSMFRM